MELNQAKILVGKAPVKISKLLLLGIIASLFIVPSALAGIVYFSQWITNVNMNKAGSMTSNNPSSLTAFGGDIYTYNWTATNNANQDLKYLVEIFVNESTLETGEAKLQLYNASSALLAESITATSGQILATSSDLLIPAGQTINGSWKIQWNQSADNVSYQVGIRLKAGTFAYS